MGSKITLPTLFSQEAVGQEVGPTQPYCVLLSRAVVAEWRRQTGVSKVGGLGLMKRSFLGWREMKPKETPRFSVSFRFVKARFPETSVKQPTNWHDS